MSNNVKSGIFDAINNYLLQECPSDIQLSITSEPLDNADIYHYHRPNLEKELKQNSIVTVHHDLEDTDSWFNIDDYLNRYKEAKTIVCLNSTQRKKLYNLGFNNTEIIPHGVNKYLFKQNKKTLPIDKINIGIISKRYNRRVKGEVKFSEYLKRLDNTKFKFTFVGEGRSVEHNLATKYGFESIVFEQLPYFMFDSLYENIDILMVNSLFEGGPANIPEALYTRTPIVARRIAMISDLLVENINGIFLTDNIDYDINHINQTFLNKDNYKKLLNNINNTDSHVLSWEDVAQKYFEIYRKKLG